MHRVLVTVIGLLMASAATASEIYRWRDSDGGFHYGRNPPANVDAAPVTATASDPPPAALSGSAAAQRSAPRNDRGAEPRPHSSARRTDAGQNRGRRVIVHQRSEPAHDPPRRRRRHDQGRGRHHAPSPRVILRAECGNGGAASVTRQSRSEQRRAATALSLSISNDGPEGAVRLGSSRRTSRRTTRVFAGGGGGCR